ncbi:DUF933 domain-containing protein [bacterium]|nr:DUF933 domain-containing protein [bacterium]
MQVGLVGLAASGKTTLFELLSNTKGAFLSPDKANTATVDVPDERVDKLSALYKPKKTIYAQISFTDTCRLSPGDSANNNKALNHLKLMDALAVILNGFAPGCVSRNILSDLDICLSEMIFSDLEQVERKLERIKKQNKTSNLAGVPEEEIFKKLAATLESNTMLSALELPPGVYKELLSYSFLTFKPVFVVVNLSEEHSRLEEIKEFEKVVTSRGMSLVKIYVKLEKDLQELPPEDRESFREEYCLPLNGKAVFIQQAYSTVNLISYFTVGSDEVRAWTISRGCPAKEAAGVIHKDLMNYFVRAEVISFDRLLECGSEQEASRRGLLRAEKKEYPVKDGDILHILSTK